MNNEKHTPTPWTNAKRDIFSSTAEYIADVKANLRISPQQADANAAFIVTACNAYEANQATISAQKERIAKLEAALEEYDGATRRVINASNSEDLWEISNAANHIRVVAMKSRSRLAKPE